MYMYKATALHKRPNSMVIYPIVHVVENYSLAMYTIMNGGGGE